MDVETSVTFNICQNIKHCFLHFSDSFLAFFLPSYKHPNYKSWWHNFDFNEMAFKNWDINMHCNPIPLWFKMTSKVEKYARFTLVPYKLLFLKLILHS